MAKKKKSDPAQFFASFDPAVEPLAMERFLSSKQLFDYRTHRLKPHVRDQMQARAILIRAQQLAIEHNKELILSYLEKKLLDRAVNDRNHVPEPLPEPLPEAHGRLFVRYKEKPL